MSAYYFFPIELVNQCLRKMSPIYHLIITSFENLEYPQSHFLGHKLQENSLGLSSIAVLIL